MADRHAITADDDRQPPRARAPNRWLVRAAALAAVLALSGVASSGRAESGEALYQRLSRVAKDPSPSDLFATLNARARTLEWDGAPTATVDGNLRLLERPTEGALDQTRLYLVREIAGDLAVLALPADTTLLEEGAESVYAGLDGVMEGKHAFTVSQLEATVGDHTYRFVRLNAQPAPLLFDVVFKISSVLMLFLVMAGMGMSLSPKDFAIVAKKPRAIIVGTLVQFGVMPLVAFALGHLAGIAEHSPFVFAGAILITAVPGGATSNLMTHLGKGDVALSISLTASATFLSLLLTPALLAIYCTNIPDVEMPVKMLAGTILVLVLIPLLIGMGIRAKAPGFAQRSVKPTSIVGVVALLVVIVGGVLGNLDKLTDFERNGLNVWGLCLALTVAGMILGVLLPKLSGLTHFQTRAIAMEVGIRNAVLAMVIAILIQDTMGDFYSSMFAMAGIFALLMYVAGLASIALHRRFLPTQEDIAEEPSA